MTVTMKFLILTVEVLCCFMFTEAHPSPVTAEENIDLADRIVGGQQAQPNSHPYIVSLNQGYNCKTTVIDAPATAVPATPGPATTTPSATTATPTTTTTPMATPTTTMQHHVVNWWKCWHGKPAYCPSWYKNGNNWSNHGNNHYGNNYNRPHQYGYYHNYGGYGKRVINNGHFCGGTLISDRHVLTAAHCIEDDTCIKVVLGEFDRKTHEGEVERRAVTVHKDPNFDNNLLRNDVALLTLDEPVVFNTAVNKIDLASQEPTSGQSCKVAGWGTTSEGASSAAEKLREVTVPIVSRGTCKSNYGSNSITEGMICAGYTEGGKDSCQGDSGGPLLCKENGMDVLAGIVSWGDGCAQPGSPGVYTDVSKYAAWIQNAMN